MKVLKCKPILGYYINLYDRLFWVESSADKFGWKCISYQKNIGMISFQKVVDNFNCRINVYLTTMTVTTYIKHPKKGKGQLFRKNVSTGLLWRIFMNPRVHTKIGYSKKQQK